MLPWGLVCSFGFHLGSKRDLVGQGILFSPHWFSCSRGFHLVVLHVSVTLVWDRAPDRAPYSEQAERSLSPTR